MMQDYLTIYKVTTMILLSHNDSDFEVQIGHKPLNSTANKNEFGHFKNKFEVSLLRRDNYILRQRQSKILQISVSL